MNEERNERTIGELTTWSPDGEWPETDTREEQKAGGDWQWDPSQTIGEMETIAPEKGPGTMLLAKRYRALRRLGEGGMGSVWLAEDTKLDNRLVAIKMLPAVLAGKKGAYRQVKQEALMAMKLSHPNIATVRAFEEDEGGAPFLVMDYIEGMGLDEILSERGPLGEEEVLKLLGPVAAALDYAHSQGVVHRDVKPGNVMVRKDGTPFMLDFGIAREIQETMTRVTGKFSSGTLLYMSPEQLRGRAPKAAQDVYSFAAMAYECLAGHPPFYRGAVEDQIKNEPPEELEESVASAGLRKGIMAGLAKVPEGRPGSCAGVLANGGASTQCEPEKVTSAGGLAGKTEGKGAGKAVATTDRPEGLPHQRDAEAERAVRVAEARAEAERKARKEAEEAAREARRKAQSEELAAQQAQEARGRSAGLAWFLVVVMVLGGLVAYGVWQREQERAQPQILCLQQETEVSRKAQQEAEAKWKEAAEAQRKAQQEAEAQRRAQQEAEAKWKEEAEALRKAQAEAEALRKALAEAEVKRTAQGETQDKQQEGEVSPPPPPVMPPGGETLPSPVQEPPVWFKPRSNPIPAVSVEPNVYVVQNGDSFAKIAANHGCKTAELKELNNIKDANKIFVGQKLLLPDRAKASTSPPHTAAPAIRSAGPNEYILQKGDALSKVAAKFGCKTKDLMKLNNIKDANKTRVGQKLRLPGSSRKDFLVYTVQDGDTVESISRLFVVGSDEIRLLNGISPGDEVKPGCIIKIPPTPF